MQVMLFLEMEEKILSPYMFVFRYDKWDKKISPERARYISTGCSPVLLMNLFFKSPEGAQHKA
jgi:hypothetical protein